MGNRDRLYRVNRYNRGMLSDRIRQNIFAIGGYSGGGLGASLQNNNSAQLNQNSLNTADLQSKNNALAQFLTNYGGKSDAISNPWSFKQSFSSEGLKAGMNAGAGAAIGAGAATIGGMAGDAIGGGLHSGAGDAIGNIGGSLGSAVGAVNPVLGAAISVGSKIIGGLTNRAFGTAVDEAKLQAAKSGTSQLNNFVSNASSFDAIEGPQAIAKVEDAYKGGWFSSSEARRKNEELKRARKEAELWAKRGVENNVFNLQNNQMSDLLASYHAYGGGLDMPQAYALGVGTDNSNNMGAIGYGFMSDYLNSKRRQAEQKNNMGNMFAGMPSSMFAFGGDMQTNSADFSTGLVHIDAGGTHSENPNDGVQMGIDSEGVPNLVEEGETVYDDYVFSNRILADEATKKLFHLPKKKDITFADISKKLEREIQERPNDVISKSGFKAQMQTLEEQQERQKQEMEAERAKAAFEALSPEEQTAVMQNAAEQEQRAQQAAQEQAITEQQAMQQPSPEEAAMMQQQISPEEQLAMEQQQLAQMQANVSALGGELVRAGDVKPQANKFAVGGRKARRIVKKYDKEWFSQMAKSLGISDDEFRSFNDRFTEDNPEANLAAFNDIYRASQKAKAQETYRTGQRQSKKNELFGNSGLYRYSADKKHLYRGRVNDADRVGYINKDYTGDSDNDGNILGFLTAEDYNKKRAAYEAEKDGKKKAELLNELEGYKAINEKAGDYMYDFYGKRLETPETMSEDEILQQYDADYANGFKWDDKDAQTLQYPIGMEHSDESYLRYVPALGGAIGLFNDLFSSPDYSRAEGIQKVGQITPMMVRSNFNPTYMTYRPLDIWYGQNALNAQSRATDRALLNSSSPSRMAGLIANGYNSQLASGNLFRQAQEYNDALDKQVITHNSGENKAFAQFDLQSQLANQRAAMEAGMHNARYKTLGYQMMDDIDARRNASINANLTNVLQSIGNIGEEAYDTDRLRWLERTGVLKSKTLGANGGKLKKKKKGLTY